MQKKLENLSSAFFIPAIVVFVIFVGWPTILSLRMSLHDTDLFLRINTHNFVGLDNFRNFLSSPDFLGILGNSLIFFLGSLFLTLAVAIPTSSIVGNMKKGTARSISTIALLLPAFIPDIFLAYMVTPLPLPTTDANTFSLLIIVLSSIRPASVCAFIGACAAGICKDRGKNALHGALAGVFIGVSISIIRFLSSNLELYSIFYDHFFSYARTTFDMLSVSYGLIRFDFSYAATAWVVKTALQIIIAVIVSFAAFFIISKQLSFTQDEEQQEKQDEEQDEEHVGKVLPGVLFAIIFFVALFLPLASSGSSNFNLLIAINNSMFMTSFSLVAFGGFIFLFVMGFSMRLHKRGSLILVLILIAIVNNALGNYIFYADIGIINTYWPVIISGAFCMTFIFPLAYLTRLRGQNATSINDMVRNLLPYMIAFCGLFVAKSWAGYSRQFAYIISPNTTGLGIMFRNTMFDEVATGLILWVALPILVVAVITVVGFALADKKEQPQNVI